MIAAFLICMGLAWLTAVLLAIACLIASSRYDDCLDCEEAQ